VGGFKEYIETSKGESRILMQEAKVIGPIKEYDWLTLRMLLSSIHWMLDNNNNSRFERAIKKEKELYKEYLTKYVKRD
jgi:hypothetical protein